MTIKKTVMAFAAAAVLGMPFAASAGTAPEGQVPGEEHIHSGADAHDAGHDESHSDGKDHAHDDTHSHADDHVHDDNHDAIKALAVPAAEAVTVLEDGLQSLTASLAAQDEAASVETALSLLAAVKTLEADTPSDRQAAALKQLAQQIDGAQHAAQDGAFDKAQAATAKAASALKLYQAVR